MEQEGNGIECMDSAAVADNTPADIALDIIRGKWTTRVILALRTCEAMRFGELKRSLDGVTNTMLADALHRLEREGVILRQVYDEMPIRVEYSLTTKGRDMLPIYREITKWLKEYGYLSEDGSPVLRKR